MVRLAQVTLEQLLLLLTRKGKLISQEILSLLPEQTKDLRDTIRVPQCQRHMMIWWSKDQVGEVGDRISALLKSGSPTVWESISNG